MRILLRAVIALVAAGSFDVTPSPIHARQERQTVAPTLETAPAPRLAVPAVQLFPSPGGFQIALSRPMAILLRDTLDTAASDKEIARLLRENAQLKREAGGDGPAQAARLEFLAFVVSSQLPTFKKSMHERMGTNGVVIQVMGLQRERLFRKPRPILEAGVRITEKVLAETSPEEVGRTFEAAKAMIRTTPLSWSVLPQE